MRRSLASQYRVKTAHHLLNIVALKREMDTYNVEGLLKAASTGHSKEACLKYAALHTALLFEKRAVEELGNVGVGTNTGGYNSPYFGGSGGYPARPNPIPGLHSTGPGTAPAPGVQGGGVPMGIGGKASLKQQPAPTPPAGPGFFSRLGSGIANAYDNTTTGIANGLMGAGGMASDAAGATTDYLSGGPRLIGDAYRGAKDTVRSFPYGTGESKPVPNVNSMNVPQQDALIAKNQAQNDAAQKLKNKGTPAVTAANAVAATPTTPTPASVIPKPAKPARAAKPVNPDTFNDITGKTTPVTTPQQRAFGQKATNIASGVGNFMSNFGKTTGSAVNSASNAMGGATPPSAGGYAASQSAYGASPAAASAPEQSDYDSQIAESQRYSDASKQQGDEDAYMKSIEPTAPSYKASPPAESSPVAQEEVAQKSQPQAVQPQAPQGRQTVIGSGAPLQAMKNNRQMRVQNRKGFFN